MMKKIILIVLIALIAFSQPIKVYSQTTPYNYYIGPWVWVEASETIPESHWKAPDGTVGLLDLRSISAMGKKEIPEGYGFFAVNGTLPAPYVLISSGFIATAPVSNATKNKIEQYLGYKPIGSTLLDVIWDLFTNGADATGTLRLKPLMPIVEGKLELWLGGHSLLRSESFVYGVHPHTAKVRAVIQEDYRKIREESIAHGSTHYLKVLDMLGEKYKVRNPEDEFIPSDLPKESPLPHETTITEDWNCANADAIDCDLTWTETETYHDLDIATNGLAVIATDPNYNHVYARAESDLSGTDHYAQLSVTGYSATTSTNGAYHAGGGPSVRFASAADTMYVGWYWDDNSDDYIISKVVTGTRTNLGSSAGVTLPATPFTVKITANGSALDLLISDSSVVNLTDTAITTGTRTGVYYYKGKWSGTDTADDFSAADLSAPSSSIKTINGLALASVKTVNGLAKASVKTVNGLA